MLRLSFVFAALLLSVAYATHEETCPAGRLDSPYPTCALVSQLNNGSSHATAQGLESALIEARLPSVEYSARLVKRSPVPVFGLHNSASHSNSRIEVPVIHEHGSSSSSSSLSAEELTIPNEQQDHHDWEISAMNPKQLAKELDKVHEYLAELRGIEGISEKEVHPVAMPAIPNELGGPPSLLEGISPEMRHQYDQTKARLDAQSDAFLEKINAGTEVKLGAMKSRHSLQLKKKYERSVKAIRDLQKGLKKVQTTQDNLTVKNQIKAAEMKREIRRQAWDAHSTLLKLKRWYQDLNLRYAKLTTAVQRSQN